MHIRTIWALSLLLAVTVSASAQAQVIEYGDEDLSNTGIYPNDPKIGATLLGLAPNTVTFAASSYRHRFPFAPAPGDYAGTDQIYVGSVQTGGFDGYSRYGGRLNGPQTITLDYGSLLPAGSALQTLTLGVAADDFQFTAFGQPFTAAINGVTDTALTNALNRLNQTGPYVQFLTFGIDPTQLNSSNVLTLSINEGGNGGDGWSLDFLTVGVTSTPTNVPEPGAYALLIGSAFFGANLLRRRHRK